MGRAIVEGLLDDPACHVVVLELDGATTAWVADHSAASRIGVVRGDAADVSVAGRAADLAEASGTLTGWVNNAAVFRDASLHDTDPGYVLELIESNLMPAIVGCAVAVGRFLAAGTRGAIVNVSSHQAARPVAGALPYATAKAALEGLTRAAAVDYGPNGIRVNAVSLGSIVTDRLERFLDTKPHGGERMKAELAQLHPLGRPGEAAEVAEAVSFLLGDRAGFITGVVLPVDGGRSVRGADPEAI